MINMFLSRIFITNKYLIKSCVISIIGCASGEAQPCFGGCVRVSVRATITARVVAGGVLLLAFKR
jgi:hypothetical protein